MTDMTDNNKKTEELSINQSMSWLYKRIDELRPNTDNHSKIKEIANILQESVIKDFKQYNSK
jgi:hypothetical protein